MNADRHVIHLLSDYIDGCLRPSVARRVEAHLNICPACARELEQWRELLRLISLHAPVPCPIDCAEIVLQQLEGRAEKAEHREGRGRRPPLSVALPWQRLPTAWAATALLVLSLAGGWSWLRTTRSAGGWWRPAAMQVDAGASRRGMNGMAPAARREGAGHALPMLTGNATYFAAGRVLRADGPDRLEGALGRSDSLILASDFAEEDR